MSESRVVVSVEDCVARVTLNRPDKRNGLDLAMFEALVAAGAQVQADKRIRAVVLHGAGPAFCAGLDWPSFMAAADEARQRLLVRDGVANIAQRVGWIWQEVAVPVVAAIHGAAFGGGLQIALGADLRIVGPDAKLSVMEVRYGLVPDMGATRTLLGQVRDDVARELTFTGRIVDAVEAVSIGLATRLADDPLAAALGLAHTIARHSPDAVRAAKRMYQRARGLDVRAAFELETATQLELLGTKNQLEAAMSVLQKREPTFDDPTD